MNDILGGSYKEITSTYKQLGLNHGCEAHHIFGYASYKNVLELKKSEGPSIRMDKEDHRETSSYDFRKEAEKYRDDQRKLLEQGKFREAWMMDVNDIKLCTGQKLAKCYRKRVS